MMSKFDFQDKKLVKELVQMNLQFFADDPGDSGSGEDPGAGTDGENPDGDKKSDDSTIELTAEELQRRIDSETDRKLEKALQKRQKEWQKETDRKIQEAIEEKERLSKLSEKERKEEELTLKEQELARKEAEIARKELRSEAMDDLQSKGLPSQFADFLLGEDAEETLDNINGFKKAFDEAVNKAVKEKLRQDTPPAGGSGGESSKIHSLADMRNKQAQQTANAPDPWARN